MVDTNINIGRVDESNLEINLENLSTELQEMIQFKQIQGGLETNALESHYFAINYSRPIGIPASIGTYIPLFRVESHDNGKTQLFFDLTSREDSSGYYAKYLFVSHGDHYALMRFKYVNNILVPQRVGAFDRESICVLKYNIRKYLILKKVQISEMDVFITNIYFKDVAYAYVYPYTTPAQQVTDTVLQAEALSSYNNLSIEDYKESAVNCENDPVTTLTAQSTDQDVPSAKAVYENITNLLSIINNKANLSDLIVGNIEWGNVSRYNTIQPLWCLLRNQEELNPLRGVNPSCFEFEYSTDAGNTWNVYNITSENKSKFFGALSHNVSLNGAGTTATTSMRLRVTISYDYNNTTYLYGDMTYAQISINQHGSSNNKVIVSAYKKSSDRWSTIGEYDLTSSGAWTAVPLSGRIGGYKSDNAKYRFEFICGNLSESGDTFSVSNILIQSKNIFNGTKYNFASFNIGSERIIYTTVKIRGLSGSVSNGDTYMVTGGTVYTALKSKRDKRPVIAYVNTHGGSITLYHSDLPELIYRISDGGTVVLPSSGVDGDVIKVYAVDADIVCNGDYIMTGSYQEYTAMNGAWRKIDIDANNDLLEITESNLATYWDDVTQTLTLPANIHTVVFAQNNSIAIKYIAGITRNGHRLSLLSTTEENNVGRGKFSFVQLSSGEYRLSSYIHSYVKGNSTSALDTTTWDEGFVDLILYNKVWFSKTY